MRRAFKAGAVLAGAVVASGALVGVASAKSTAVPASTVTFGNGECTAQFVRSASGIVNETNRVCDSTPNNPWVDADVWLQFRPLDSTPNPACDPAGLAANPFTDWTNRDAAIAEYFGSGHYNVCVYLVNPVVASGTVASNDPAGATAALPAGLIGGKYRIDVSGTWTNAGGHNVADAEYVSFDGWTSYVNGYDVSPFFLGEGFGDLQVDQQFVDWGAYSATHDYAQTVDTSGSSINLRVFDGNSNDGPNAINTSWYGDNSGTLGYTITYLGQ